MKKQYAVLGLGSFGHSVAVTLEKMGCDVVAVDKSYEKIQEISDEVSYAVRADAADTEALQTLGGRNLDGAVIAISDNLEASIMAVIACKEMGIPHVIVKAKDELHGTVLMKIGADAVIYPEQDMGMRVAKNIMSSAFADWIDLSDDYSLIELKVPRSWIGKTLSQLEVRKNYDVNIVGKVEEGKLDIALDPETPLPQGAILIMLGANDSLEAVQNL